MFTESARCASIGSPVSSISSYGGAHFTRETDGELDVFRCN